MQWTRPRRRECERLREEKTSNDADKPDRVTGRVHRPRHVDRQDPRAQLMEISGRTFLVTGGGSGLGAATARGLAAGGANVVVADLEGREVGDNFRFVETDVTDEESVQAAVDAALELGGLDGAINCAGVAAAEKVLGKKGPHSLASFTRAVQINLVGTFNVIRLAAAAMQENEPAAEGERGVIVNTASVAAYDGQIGQAAYAPSKGGVVSL